MVVSAAVKRRYDDMVAYVPALQRLVREQLPPFAEENGFSFHDRVKTLDSVGEKLESGRIGSWSELDDLYACVLVVPTMREEQQAIDGVTTRFEEVRTRRRQGTPTPPDVFRFDCVRIVARLRPSPERVGSPVESLLFEVQVRTAFEHAWSVTMHSRAYKTDVHDWKRQRLAAALRASVERIDVDLVGFERTAAEVLPARWEEADTKVEILETYKRLFETARLPGEIKPKAWSRFVDNTYALCTAEARRRYAEKKPKAEQISRVVREAMREVEAWASTVPQDLVPRSLSLFQSTFGVLCRARVLAPTIDFPMPGVEDVVTIFPEVRGIASREI